jgi:putative nucleotidyltransferase with HDIG domain
VVLGLNLTVFKSRLAKRFFGIFVLGSLIPIMALAMVSYYRVSQQLTNQALDRLKQSSKTHALSIYNDLLEADQQLQNIQLSLPNTKSTPLTTLSSSITKRNQELFTGLVLLRDGKIVFSWGNGVSNTLRERVSEINLAKNKTQAVSLGHGDTWPTIAIVRRIESSGGSKNYLIGTIDPSFLWQLKTGTSLPPASEFSVWDDQGQNLFCSLGFPVVMDKNLSSDDGANSGVQTTVEFNNESYFAFSRSTFMKPRFHVPYWTVMVMEPRDYVLHSLRSFRMIFLSILAMSFVIVIFLTNRAIGKSLTPIDALMHGASQVANGTFSHRVVVKSRDEFQDLATSFNLMTHELDTQFNALIARSDLDSAVLSVLDIDRIISASLGYISSFFPHSTTAISIVEAEEPLQGSSYVREKNVQLSPFRVESFQLRMEEYALFLENRNFLIIDIDKMTPFYLMVLRRPDIDRFIVFPIWIQNRLYALVSIGINTEMEYSQKSLEQIRGFTDHLAIAFANSDLLKRLKDLNMGTLYALARTVDAKSSWTAGHSMRVGQIALNVAKVLGSPQEVLDELQQAALLHDIGKIGIPQSIIDKPGKLTDEEYNIIKSHPSIGARILNPIRAYASIIPIVEQHHERYDGKGYPFGKSGEEIHLSARIMALADTFDALVSDRPYRAGLSQEQATRIIREESGRQFDPRIVEAFNQVVSSQKGVLIYELSNESSISSSTLISAAPSTEAKGNGSRLQRN